MTNTGKKHNINIYIADEIYSIIESKRGLVPRSTFIEDMLKKSLILSGDIEYKKAISL